MAEIPTSRKTDQELLAMQKTIAERPMHPAASTAKVPQREDLPLSVGDWLITLIVLAIPVVNILLYIYWAFFSKGNVSRRNFCKASLILMVFGVILALVLNLS